jgi:hypothetical protein
MPSVSHARRAGQAPAPTFDVNNPRAVFVCLSEAREAFEDLAAVAADATRPLRRRKLTRTAARERLERARVALAWLYALPLAAPEAPALTADRFERWAE